MTDTDKLKRLAEDYRIGGHFITVDRRTILALIAENERLRAQVKHEQACTFDENDRFNEAVALLRELFIYQNNGVYDKQIDDFLYRIDASE